MAVSPTLRYVGARTKFLTPIMRSQANLSCPTGSSVDRSITLLQSVCPEPPDTGVAIPGSSDTRGCNESRNAAGEDV